MPTPLPALDATARLVELASDADLLEQARAGAADPEAVAATAELYRRHRDVALRLAGRLCDERDVEDVVADAFARVLAQLASGGGPRSSFRAYLLTAVRHAHVDHVRRDAPLVWTDDPASTAAVPDETDRREESRLLSRVLRQLPDRWQLVLWWTLVERRSLDDVGARLDLSPNAAAALAFRAREGLRLAYVAEHVAHAADPRCAPWRDRLASLHLGRLTDAQADDVRGHLAGCGGCAATYDELRRLRPASLVAA
ncbi:RNA polymerase sigma factor [Nocardioides zeae]|uniref:RNA polymerase sigma factor (Sigma-70 family) n=1 Tax=Nocardioides zeae TaxID=1457234 RepID=A0AAJ1U6V8_9ACTN|nr:sigma-70 family RNA polymerase sigma factor [Nocardioides zeae]MDQ1105611.1 RNA polymerase sigma factor (sigma-70 family) [Nocardioides zeae]